MSDGRKTRRFPTESMSSDDLPETEHLLGSQRQLPRVSTSIGVAGRRQSLTAPPSPTDSRKKPNRHNYINQLHHLIHWKEIWGEPHKTQSLQRSESMVSLACFKTLSQLATQESPEQLQQYLAGTSHVNVDDRDENGTTALMCASESGRIAAVRLLLSFGADPNAADEDGWTSLALAARGGHVPVVKELLDAMAKVDPRDCGGWTPLMWASYKGHEDVVAALLEHGADVHAHGNYNINSLVWAAGRGHSGVVRRLLAAGARAASCDKYATSALTWAARKGDTASCAALLQAGADPSSPGMHCWTPLLQAAQGNHVEIVLMLLEHKPNVNALDKDGYTALAIACKEGFYDVAVALINSGAYINVQDHSKDTPLIHAVKGGHKGIVEALLKKHVDVDLPGKERKTPVYNAVEKGHVAILKLLLASNPDLELATVSGDTPLLRAVRSRNAEMVQLLIERKARVNVTDNRGDTALHIAMRARCKQIVEILLRNPKNSQMLYKPNKMKETPYNIDMSYNRSILAQVFGARRLNASEPSESMLGYELYSAALADVLAEPSLAVPITVGLYARWGSGKSFLLNKLKEEMLNFASSWREDGWAWSWAVWWAAWHAALAVAAAVFVAGAAPHAAAAVCFTLFAAFSCALYLLWFLCNRYEWWWADAIGSRCNSLLLLLQVTFCHPPGPRRPTAPPAMPIRFHFTEGMKSMSGGGTGQEGEASVVAMIASLAEALECQYGRVCTRLARAFRPVPLSSTAEWKWRRVCCVPHIVTFELCFTCILIGVAVLIVYLTDSEVDKQRRSIQEGVMLGACALAGCVALANVYTWGRMLAALLLPPRLRLSRAVRNETLRQEVKALTEVVSCLDAFTGQQTRLVVVVDALDSCEQEKVLNLLNSVHALCSDPDTPFVLLLAIDPHIISKAVEVNSRRSFSEINIGGWDYLRNMVQLPFYLQNSALRKVKVAQQTAAKRMQTQAAEDFSTSLQRSVSARRLSSTSEVMSSQERIKNQPTKEAALRARRLRPSDSVASSVASGLHRGGTVTGGGAAELGRVLLTDDYFSDVNPRSVRRLMNVLYVTGRLLKAFQIEFNWYQLAWWVNLTEQWPFRTSFLIHHHETYHEHIDDATPLKHIYEKVKPVVGRLRESSVLMELDRDERKLEVFLSFHRATLTAADIKVFLPFTINLDPYIKKLIKEELQQYGTEEEGAGSLVRPPHSKMFHRKHRASPPSVHPVHNPTPMWVGWADSSSSDPFHHVAPTQQMAQSHVQTDRQPASIANPYQVLRAAFPNIGDLSTMRLSALSVDRVCSICRDALGGSAGEQAATALRMHHVGGLVLMHCELDELKPLMQLPFGDWELFKMLITNLRHLEANMPLYAPLTVLTDKGTDSEPDAVSVKPPRKEGKSGRPSNVEKQVTLEEQMICGALQTLNEEAFEDQQQEPSAEEDSELRLPSSMTRGNRREVPAVTFNIECEDSDDEQISFSVPTRTTTPAPAPSVRYRSRPTSLVVNDDAAGDVQKTDIVADTKLNALKKSIETLKKVSSAERLSRLKDKIMSRGNGSRDRSPPRDEIATDDESAPLVSPLSPAAPPCIVSSSDSSPSRSNSHSKKSSPNKRSLGIACNNRSLPDVTASTDYSPRSDCTDVESPRDGANLDLLPEGKNDDAKSSSKPSVERQESQTSVSNMVEPYNMRLLSRGATDRLWRQDALDGAPPWPWGDPDSVV